MVVMIYYEFIDGSGGIPEVLRNLAMDISDAGPEVFLCDFDTLYRPVRSEGVARLKQQKVGRQPADIAILLPTRRLLRDAACVRKLRSAGTTIVLLPWGLLARQQARGNWSGGKLLPIFKRLARWVLVEYWKRAAHHFWVFSPEEAWDSRLPASRCVEVPMGNPHNALAARLEEDRVLGTRVASLGDPPKMAFIGRGAWRAKGLDKLARYSLAVTAERFEWYCYVPSMDSEFRQSMEVGAVGRLKVGTGVTGEGLADVLKESAAVITVPRAPAPLRVLCEALYGGTSIVCGRNAYMEGFAIRLRQEGLPCAVTILQDELDDAWIRDFKPCSQEERARLAAFMQGFISPSAVGAWFKEWMAMPSSPRSFYQEAMKHSDRVEG